MGAQALTLHDAPASFPRGRWIGLALLAAAQITFAACCSPFGLRSGQWSAPWLPYADFLIETASGAIVIYPLLLYPLWVSFGRGRLLLRFAVTLALCAGLAGAAVVPSFFRRFSDPPALQIILTVVWFSLMTLGLWSVRPLTKWRLGVPGAPAAPSRKRPNRVQFRLRHLFECMALVACILAAFRFYFPDDLPADSFADWPRLAWRFCRHMPAVVLIYLPTALVPWAVLAFRSNGGLGSRLLFAASAFGWVGLDLWIVWYGGVFGPFRAFEVLSIQLGASAAGLISAIYLRICGYRIFRVEREHG
ncbi:MAG TPA: hypothetical protein VHB99_20040 [Pirellulales bacterium]|nr:hypothetical protein [Pirellulales bacterium]